MIGDTVNGAGGSVPGAATDRCRVAAGAIDELEPAAGRSSEGSVPRLDAGVGETEGGLAFPPLEDDGAVEVGADGSVVAACLRDAVEVATGTGLCATANGLVDEPEGFTDDRSGGRGLAEPRGAAWEPLIRGGLARGGGCCGREDAPPADALDRRFDAPAGPPFDLAPSPVTFVLAADVAGDSECVAECRPEDLDPGIACPRNDAGGELGVTDNDDGEAD